MKSYRFFIVAITVVLALALSSPLQADKFTDTIGVAEGRVQHVGPQLRGSTCDQNELFPVCGGINYV